MNNRVLRILEFDKIKNILKKYTKTPASKEIIDKLVPYDNIYEVKMHLEESMEALNATIKKGSPPFDGLYDVRDYIHKVSKGGVLNPSGLLKIANLLRCSRRFKDYIKVKEGEERYNLLEELCENLTPLKQLEEEIYNIVISEDEIADRSSTALFNIRKSLKEKNSSVKNKVMDLLRSNSKYLQDNLYTIRGDRYVIPIKAEYRSQVPGLIHDQSSTGSTLFIEPMGLVNLNNEIKDLMLREKAEVERILREISGKIYNNIEIVKVNGDIIWELDFIFAKAKYGSEINGIIPEISKGEFNILNGRHPLIDSGKVVPINVYLNDGFSSIIITGPNTGGKTVTLKTIGLLHLMAMAGILIPANEGTVISFFEEIYADIGDEQSIEQNLSTFSSHMTNIVNIINDAVSGDLVLFDELGAGTDPTEGAALAISLLENLKERGVKVAATTHYSQLKVYALQSEGVENASMEFDVETLKPTYKLLIGIPGKSNAFLISKRLGLPDYIIEDAKKHINVEEKKFEDLIGDLQEKSIIASRHEEDARKLKLQAKEMKEKYEEKYLKFQKVRDNSYEEAKREARRILKEAKEEADEILKNMRELESLGASKEIRNKLEEQRSKLKGKIDSTYSEDENIQIGNIKSVKIGEEVILISINQKVTVLTLPDDKGDLQVQAGIMKVSVNLKDLKKNEGSSSKSNKINKREIKLNLNKTSRSLDLRGMDSEEAIYVTDKYLDEAYLAGHNEVTIIHGKGTGILRKNIGNMLKGHPHVKSHRIGEYGEGGDGATVVMLK